MQGEIHLLSYSAMRFGIAIGALMFSMLFTGGTYAVQKSPNTSLVNADTRSESTHIMVDNNLVTAVIRDEKVQDIVSLLGEKSGVEVKIFREIEGKITVNLKKTPIEEAFQQLLNNTADYVLIYSGATGADQAIKHYPRLSKILVFPKNDSGANQNGSTAISAASGTATSSVSNRSAAGGDITNPLNDPDPEVRIATIEAFGELKDERAVSYLTNALKDENEDVRESAVDSLAAIGNSAAVESIMGALDDDAPEIRETAVDALAAIGDKRAIKRLEGLLNDPDEDVRESVMLALKRLKQK
ncbi:MAG: HEAT repeat domain-containing protein [Nitrospiraceae bacterium]|nr:MAG: HEAT repeat domain-containing protein [Nitrospiraceae bacterium]